MSTFRLLMSCLWDLALVRWLVFLMFSAVLAGGLGALAGYAMDEQIISHTCHVLQAVLRS